MNTKNQEKEMARTPFIFKLSPFQMFSVVVACLLAGGILNLLFREPTAEAQLVVAQKLAPVPPSWDEMTFKQAIRASCTNAVAFDLLRQGSQQLNYTDVGSYDAVCGKKAPVPKVSLSVVEATNTQGKPQGGQ
jgi:hypothetical protein